MNQRIYLSYYNHFFKQLCQIWFHNNLRNYFVDNQIRKWSEKYLSKSLDQILYILSRSIKFFQGAYIPTVWEI